MSRGNFSAAPWQDPGRGTGPNLGCPPSSGVGVALTCLRPGPSIEKRRTESLAGGTKDMTIEEYDFGRLRVDGKEYHRDLILYPEDTPGGLRVNPNWWRQEGHRLDKKDLEEVVRARPEVLVVGTGYHGCMKVPKETIEFLNSLGIELHAKPTKEACQEYNQLKDSRKVVAALHLTC